MESPRQVSSAALTPTPVAKAALRQAASLRWIRAATRPFPLFILLALPAAAFPPTAAASPRPEQSRPDTDLLVGDLDQALYRDAAAAFLSAFGYDADVYELAKPLIEKKKKDLETRGYTVKVIDSALRSQFRDALIDPNTRAVVWFGHGEEASPGSVSARAQDGGQDVIGIGEMKTWAQERCRP